MRFHWSEHAWLASLLLTIGGFYSHSAGIFFLGIVGVIGFQAAFSYHKKLEEE